MPVYGDYETIQPLYRHGLGSVCRARRIAAEYDALSQAGSDSPLPRPNRNGSTTPRNGFAIKVLHPSYRFASPEVLNGVVNSFLDGAKAQHDTATSGASHWAPIHDMGRGPASNSAYYVTDCYFWSVQRLIGSRVNLTASALYHVVDSILCGLVELRQSLRRAHGALKPTNVLLDTAGPVENARVVLTDIAPNHHLQIQGQEMNAENRDMAALGEIIYQLVLHRPFRGIHSWPANPSPEWEALGSKAEAWRELCNRLIKPGQTQGLTLDSVTAQLRPLRAHRSALTPARISLAGAVLGAAALVGAGISYAHYASEWKQFCLADIQWLDQFQLDLRADPKRLARIEQDPPLQKVIADVLAHGADLDPKLVSGNETLLVADLADHPPLSLGALSRTDAMLKLIQRLQSAIAPDHWPPLQKISQYQRLYEQRGWEAPARYLAGLVDGARPSPGMAAGIDRVLLAHAKLEDDFVFIEDNWQAVGRAADAIRVKAPDDLVLRQFADFARRYSGQKASPSGQECTDLGSLRDALLPLKELATQLTEVLDTDWSTRIDRQRLQAEAEIYSTRAPLQASDYQQWLRQAQDYYVYQPPDLSDTIAALKGAVAMASRRIDALPNDYPQYSQDVATLKSGLERAQKQIHDDLLGKPWIQKDRRKGLIAARAASLTAAIDDVGREADRIRAEHTIDQPAWWDAFMAARPTDDSAVINATWNQWRDSFGVTRQQLPLPSARFQALRAAAQQWKAELIGLDKMFHPAASLEEPYASIARARREAKLRAVLNRTVSSGPVKADWNAVKAEGNARAEEYARWCRDLGPFIEAINQSVALLDAGYGPADDPTSLLPSLGAWKDRDLELWSDLLAQPPLASTLHRLELLKAVGTSPRSALADLAAGKSTPELTLAAWRQLSSAPPIPWPATPQELQQEIAIRKNLSNQIDQVPDSFRRQQLQEELRNQATPRLVNFLNVSRAPADLEPAFRAAASAAPALGVVPSLPSDPWLSYEKLQSVIPLDEARKFNLLLYGLRAEAAALPPATDASQVANLCEGFRDGVARISPSLSTEPSVASLLQKLSVLREPEPPHGPSTHWKMQPLGNEMVAFTSSGPASVTLQFGRVEVKDSPPAYLATTELSVGDFAAIIAASEPGGAMRQLLLNFRENADPRPGPRVWDWPAAARSNVLLSQPETWLRPHDDDFADYPPSFLAREGSFAFNRSLLDASVGGDPQHRPRLPMNYLPAPTAMHVAALLGCRLPTPAEWSARAGATSRGGHLRGVEWRTQQEHIRAQNGQPQWPDAGIFWPRDYHGPRKSGSDAESYNRAYGGLFFSDVDADVAGKAEPIFHNLLGNVAEFVWDDPHRVEQLTSTSLDDFKRLLEQDSGHLFVIGGSALSPPELPIDRPLPVDLQRAATPPNAWDGYADVGMRLAFAAPVPPIQRLAKVLATPGYLPASHP